MSLFSFTLPPAQILRWKKTKQESFPERLAVTQVSNSSNGRRAAPCKSAPDKRVEASDTFSDLILMHGGFGGNERAGLCSLGLQTARRTSARPLGGELMGERRGRGVLHTHTVICASAPLPPPPPSGSPLRPAVPSRPPGGLAISLYFII